MLEKTQVPTQCSLTVFCNKFVNLSNLKFYERDIMNYQNRGLCYLPNPKAEADNTDTRF